MNQFEEIKLLFKNDPWSIGIRDVRFLINEVDRLLNGKFTQEELHNLCHEIDKVNYDPVVFAEGCHGYQRKLFGRSPTEDLINSLKAKIAELERLG